MPPLAVLFHAPERDPSYTPSDNNSPAFNGDRHNSATSSSSVSAGPSASPARSLLAAFQAVSHNSTASGSGSNSPASGATYQSSAYRALNGVSSEQQLPRHQSSWTVYRDPPAASGSSNRSELGTAASSDDAMPEDLEPDNEQENVAPPVTRSQEPGSSASRRRRRTSTLVTSDTIPIAHSAPQSSSSVRHTRDAFTTPSPPTLRSDGRTASSSRMSHQSQARHRDVTPPSQILPASTPVRNAERVAREHLGLNDSDDEELLANASSEARRKRARLAGVPSS